MCNFFELLDNLLPDDGGLISRLLPRNEVDSGRNTDMTLSTEVPQSEGGDATTGTAESGEGDDVINMAEEDNDQLADDVQNMIPVDDTRDVLTIRRLRSWENNSLRRWLHTYIHTYIHILTLFKPIRVYNIVNEYKNGRIHSNVYGRTKGNHGSTQVTILRSPVSYPMGFRGEMNTLNSPWGLGTPCYSMKTPCDSMESPRNPIGPHGEFRNVHFPMVIPCCMKPWPLFCRIAGNCYIYIMFN